MKIYTQTFDVQQPTPKRIWVAPFSDFKIGVKATKGGTALTGDVTLKAGGAALSAESDKIDGFTIFPTQSGATGAVDYTLSVAGVAETMKLVQVVTDSTVFEKDEAGSGGGDLSNYYTKTEVDDKLSAKADESQLSDYVLDTELTAYYTKSETSSATEVGTALGNKVTNLSAVAGIMKISQADYSTLSAGGTADANTLYIIV